jgi:hypothetical protein
MVKSPKNRLFDWVANAVSVAKGNPREDIFDCLKYYFIMLSIHLEDCNFTEACEIAGQIYMLEQNNPSYRISKEQFALLRTQFGSSAVIKKYTKIGEQIWIPILNAAINKSGSQKTCNLVCYLYHIAVTRSGKFQFRGKNGCLLFWIHAIWSLCNTKEVEETWYEDANIRTTHSLATKEEIAKLIENHRNRIGLVGIPNYALDKHTGKGAQMKRSVDPKSYEEQITWLQKCITIWKNREDIPPWFKLPANYFERDLK